MNPPLPGVAYSIAPFFAPYVFPTDVQLRLQTLAATLNTPGPLPDGVLPEVRCLFAGWGIPMLDEALLTRLPNLEAVFYAAGSVRGFMTDAAWERGIVVSTAAEENNLSVAEYCVATILFSLKHGWRLAREVKRMRRFPDHQQCVPGIYGGRVGLVSFGRIARKLCALLRGYPLEIVVWDPYVSGGEIAAAGARRASIEEVFEIADVVSVHAPLLDETEKLIDGALLARMKHGATFINTSRGAIVDEPALIEFLRQRTDVDAVLDVTEPEPPLAASPLFDLPNVLITPHLAGCYGPECRRLGQFAVEEFQRHLAGQPLRGLVSREEALRTA